MTKLDPRPTTRGAGRHLLLVEDSPIQRRVLGEHLRAEGFEVTAVSSAVEARDRLVEARPHAVVCDVVMPDMDGFALCRAIKDDPAVAAIPVILVTSTDIDDSDERLSERAGAEALVPRTPGFAPLLDSLLACLEGARRESAGDTLLGELRGRFLADGRADVPRVLAAVAGGELGEAARRTVHRWAGRGSTLGFPMISRHAREVEEACARGDTAGARAALAALDRLFREIGSGGTFGQRRAEDGAPRGDVPAPIAEGLAGRRVGLVGFTPAEAERVDATFATAGARAEPVAWREGGPAAAVLSGFDLVALAADGDTPPPWLSPAALAACDAPLLVVGSANSLVGAARQFPTSQLLVAPWRAHALLLRSFLALQSDGAERTARAPDGPLEVVVADDDPTILVLLEATLRNYGYRCHLAPDGEEAIELARRVRPHALVLDINMPGRDGYEVLSTLRADRTMRSIPVLLLTARHQEADIIRAFDLGASEYMVKPFNPMEFVARLRRLVER